MKEGRKEGRKAGMKERKIKGRLMVKEKTPNYFKILIGTVNVIICEMRLTC